MVDTSGAWELGADGTWRRRTAPTATDKRAVQGELKIARVKTSLLRIMISYFDTIEVTRARIGERKQSVEGDVHVVLATANRDRLGQ